MTPDQPAEWAVKCAEAVRDQCWEPGEYSGPDADFLTGSAAELIDSHAQAAWKAREREIVKAALAVVREKCSACDGSGNESYGYECEYCGRPMTAIRERFAALLAEEVKP